MRVWLSRHSRLTISAPALGSSCFGAQVRYINFSIFTHRCFATCGGAVSTMSISENLCILHLDVAIASLRVLQSWDNSGKHLNAYNIAFLCVALNPSIGDHVFVRHLTLSDDPTLVS